MNTRVIDDPSTVGWELDPDTGRWMWTGAGSDSAGAGMVIQPTEPTDPVTGLQWMDSTTGRIWIWDEDKWLEFPAGGSADAGGAGGAGGGAWEFIQEIDIPVGSSVSQVDIDGFSDEYRNYQIVVRNLASDNQNNSVLVADINVFGSLTSSNGDRDFPSWQARNYFNNSSSTVWRTDVPRGSKIPLFGIVSKNAGNDYIDTRQKLNGEIHVDTGVHDATSPLDCFTSYRATAGAGVFTYRSQGIADNFGRVKTLSIDLTAGAFGQGQFKLYGLKRD
jgi:hypothetical protein